MKQNFDSSPLSFSNTPLLLQLCRALTNPLFKQFLFRRERCLSLDQCTRVTPNTAEKKNAEHSCRKQCNNRSNRHPRTHPIDIIIALEQLAFFSADKL